MYDSIYDLYLSLDSNEYKQLTEYLIKSKWQKEDNHSNIQI